VETTRTSYRSAVDNVGRPAGWLGWRRHLPVSAAAAAAAH